MRNLNIGDWVKGDSRAGELIHGYIENINSLYETVKVKVVASDNVKTIGKTIEVISRVEKLPISDLKTEEEIIGLIDLALSTKDKEWFIELTEKLKSITGRSRQKTRAKTVPLYETKPITLEEESGNERG